MFLNDTSILVFAELEIFHCIETRASLGKLLGKSLGKMYDAWYMLFGICTCMSCTPKFWHMYMIAYGDFMIIVEPWIMHWLFNVMNAFKQFYYL